ncbi:MarR family winged helix-turn-helix transcriptional regulator [Levilactobacillus senmaizukei]|uniref:MarR family winged helix-turn-helix transcriptional regulator n=1 Tax=Levilactobacillus senmaizukei TaxID=431273 RepID=UPI00138F018F|nr:MarR family winged helix-turn-helix transcriptional regulator [Levilactobacillus senmaizukei]
MQNKTGIVHSIYQLAQIEQQNLNQHLKQLGLNPDQARVLDYVQAHPGTNQRSVATHLGRQAASTSNLLTGLSQRGWLKRQPVKDSAREKALFLTIEGTKTAAQIAQTFNQLNTLFEQGLTTKQLDDLVALLTQLTRYLEKVGD